MKKIYVSLLSLLFIGSLSASNPNAAQQKKNSGQNKSLTTKLSSQNAMRNGSSVNQPASVIWSDDFSVPSNWTIAAGPGTTDNWTIGTTPPGGPPYNIDPIASTTAANNFALFDSNVLCSGNQVGNLTTTSAVNCTGHSAVRLVFQEFYRRFVDSTFVYISNNATTWTKFPVNASMAVNDFCGANPATGTNPTTVTINVSSVAANQATVYVRFTFYSPSSLGTGSGCGYAWMVDDVSLEDIPSDDVAMADEGFPGEYTIIPLTQVQPMNIYANVRNNGASVATNVGVQLDIYRIQSATPTNVYSNTSPTVATLNPGDTANILAGTYTPDDTGLYVVQYVSMMSGSDADMSNDTLYRYFFVDDSTYARDYSPVTGMLDNSLGANNNNEIFLGQIYDVITPASLTSVSFYLAAPTLGNTVTASVYGVTAGVPDPTPISSTPVYSIAGGDTDGVFLTLAFSSPVSLSTGQYLVSVDQLQNDSNITLGFTNNIFTPNTGFFQFNADGTWTTIEAGGFPGSFVIQPNFQSSVGVNELAVSNNLEIFPNPSNGLINVVNKGVNKNFTVKVYNPVGQLVYSEKYDQLTKATINLSKQTAGVYSISFESDKEHITKTFIISNK
jgi:FlaG/FlaF family flagellin (archaellin)